MNIIASSPTKMSSFRGDYAGLTAEEGKMCTPDLGEIELAGVTDNISNHLLQPLSSSTEKKKISLSILSSLLEFFRRRPWVVIFFLICATLIDILVIYFQFSMPKLHHVEVFLDPVGSDMKINMQGRAQLSAATISIEPNKLHCMYLFQSSPSDKFSTVGDIVADFSSLGESSHFGADISLHNTKYNGLRHILRDFSSVAPVTSSLRLNCDVTFTTTWFFVPLTTTIPFSQDINIEELKKQQEKSNGENEVSLGPRLSMETQDVTMQHIELLLNIRLHSLRKKLQIESFLVHIPTLVYVAALVDRADTPKSYLRLGTESTSVDLAAPHPQAQIAIKLSCTPLVSSPDLIHAANGSCTLLSPLDLAMFHDELTEQGFMNVTAHSLASNFIASFLGEYHFLKSVDPSLFPGSLLYSDDDNMSSGEHRALTVHSTSTSGSSNTISTGASCVTVDSDGVYISQACLIVDSGFFKMYLGIYNDAGSAGYIKSVTSWSPTGDSFDSQLFGSLTMDSSTYNVGGELFFSEPQQNMTLFAALNETSSASGGAVNKLFSEILGVSWDLQHALSHGSISANSVSLVSGFAPIRADGLFKYGDNEYLLKVLICDLIGQPNEGQLLTAIAAGEYGGDFTRWHWSLSRGIFSYEQSEIGSAQAVVIYDVPGENGTIGVTFLVEDGQKHTVIASNVTALNWDSQAGWLADGSVGVLSDFVAYDGFTELISWHTILGFGYGDNSYRLSVLENPLQANVTMETSTLLAPKETVHDASLNGHFLVSDTLQSLLRPDVQRNLQAQNFDYQFLLGAFGSYGGDWEDWYVN